jgi:hypothetical protein
MSTTKKLMSIVVHTDDETGIHNIGEVDFRISGELEDFIKEHGQTGVESLIQTLGYLMHRVYGIRQEIFNNNASTGKMMDYPKQADDSVVDGRSSGEKLTQQMFDEYVEEKRTLVLPKDAKNPDELLGNPPDLAIRDMPGMDVPSHCPHTIIGSGDQPSCDQCPSKPIGEIGDSRCPHQPMGPGIGVTVKPNEMIEKLENADVDKPAEYYGGGDGHGN